MADNHQFYSHTLLEGISKFQDARMRGFWQEMIGHLRGKPAELLSFEEIRTRLRLHEESYKGLQDVLLERIVGSVGRYRDFTSSFLPRTGEMQERWSRVYAQAHTLEGLPPIELYQVDDVYFVRDGNHRVSVARQMGSKYIQAHVTELRTKVDLEPGMTRRELDAAESYATFLDDTGLSHTRPHHQSLELTEPSRYGDLMGHIYLHGQLAERERGKPLSLREAAADWYDNVYRPGVTLIRKYNLQEQMGSRTEADLYLWMVDHLSEVKAELGDEAEDRSFSDALVTYLEEHRLPIPEQLRTENDESVVLSRREVQAMLAKRKAELEGGPPPTNP